MATAFTVLCESSLRATIMVIGVMIVLRALRVQSPVVLHRAWTGVLLVMLILPLLPSSIPRFPVPILPPAATVAPSAPGARPAAREIAGSTSRGPGETAGEPSFAASLQPSLQAGAKGTRWSAFEVAFVAYLPGFFILLARLIAGGILAARLAHEASGDGLPFRSRRCQAPLSVGLCRPRILLPMQSESWDAEKLGAVLAHEQAHVRRRDPLVEWLALLNRCIHWFNPLAWWLSRRLAALAEQACDEAVLEQGYDPGGYAELLLEFARSVKRGGRLVALRGSYIHGSGLEARVRRIITTGRSPAPSRIQIAMASTFGAAAILLPALATPVRAPAASPVQLPGSITAADPAAEPHPAYLQTVASDAGHPPAVAGRRSAAQQGAILSGDVPMKAGREALDRGRFDDARLAFQTLIRTRPGSPLEPEAYYPMGDSLLGQGGKDRLQKAPDAQMKIIRILMRQDQQDYDQRALVEIRKCLLLFPNSEYVPLLKQYEEEVNKRLSERRPDPEAAPNESIAELRQEIALSEVYRKWLQEEVVYIIPKWERDAFLALKTDAERDRFIESFWARRNPDPRSPGNSAKTEHYRRLAYANEHFSGSKPGWKTDRGRIYILYGEPDGKEAHPFIGASLGDLAGGGRGTTVYPYERWRYDHLAGGGTAEFTFVDSGLDRTYPLERVARYFKSTTLEADPIIMAESVHESPPAGVSGTGPVAMKVTPKVGSEYLSSQHLVPYLALYNASINLATNRPELHITFAIKSGMKVVSTVEDSEGRTCFLSPGGVIVVGSVPLTGLDPGEYTLEVKVLDRATGQTLTTGAEFTVTK